MPAEIKQEIALEIAHVLFIDVVAYSKMAMDDQRAAIEQLNQIVQSTDEYRKAESENRLLKIATGDGMALIFYHNPEDPVECALEISRALKEHHSNLRLRMGVNSGPVSGVVDVNGRANVAGAGINMPQRLMDCGDAGHILLSKRGQSRSLPGWLRRWADPTARFRLCRNYSRSRALARWLKTRR